jgi:Tol biopolymer transport system component
MNSKRFDEDREFKKFLEEHCGSTPENEFRRAALSQTRRTVEARRGNRFRSPISLALKGSALVAAILIAISFAGHRHSGMTASYIPSDRPLAVTSVSGQASLGTGKYVVLGDRVAAGERVRTGADGRVTLVTRLGSMVHMDSDTEFSIDGKGNGRITKGRLYCSNREHEIRTIEAPGGRIQLLGTVLDTHVLHADASAVTVVEGSVQLSNSHGTATVDAGRKSVMAAALGPVSGKRINTVAETAWFDRRNQVTSDNGQIAYITWHGASNNDIGQAEVWVMNADGSEKHLIRTYSSDRVVECGYWCPGKPWVTITTYGYAVEPPNVEHYLTTGGRMHLLNVSTGNDVVVNSAKGIGFAAQAVPSPTGRYIAYSKNNFPTGSLMLYDLETGQTRKVMDAPSGCRCIIRPNWSADGRYLAASIRTDSSGGGKTVVYDMKTGSVKTYDTDGWPWYISPEGKRLAGIREHRNMESLYTYSMIGNHKQVKLSPAISSFVEKGGGWTTRRFGDPQWSGDGKHILYNLLTSTYKNKKSQYSCAVFVVRSDGSGRKQIYSSRSELIFSTDWSPDGKAVFIRTISDGPKYVPSLLKVAADGSGLIKNLGGNDKDSPATKEFMDGIAEVRRGLFLFTEGKVRLFEGKPTEARNDFNDAASTFAEVTWKHPKAGLDPLDLTRNADSAKKWARLSDESMLEMSCKDRMRRAAMGQLHDILLKGYDERGRPFPTSMPKFKEETYFTDVYKAPLYGGIIKCNPVNVIECPGNGKEGPTSFIYKPITANTKPDDVVMFCPNHPKIRTLAKDIGGEWLAPWQARQKKHK